MLLLPDIGAPRFPGGSTSLSATDACGVGPQPVMNLLYAFGSAIATRKFAPVGTGIRTNCAVEKFNPTVIIGRTRRRRLLPVAKFLEICHGTISYTQSGTLAPLPRFDPVGDPGARLERVRCKLPGKLSPFSWSRTIG